MGKLVCGFSCILAALTLAPPSTALAEPIKDQGRVLIRAEGHEETFGTLASPLHAVFDYTLVVTTRGEGVLSLFVRRPNVSGESPDDPPRVSTIRFRLEARELFALQRRINDAQIGQQPNCHSFVQFFATASASSPPRLRLVWFGKARRHEFALWQGSECSAEVTALLQDLAGMAQAAYSLPTER